MTREERRKRTEAEKVAGRRALERQLAQSHIDIELETLQNRHGVSLTGGVYFTPEQKNEVVVLISARDGGRVEHVEEYTPAFPSDMLITKIMLVA